MEAKGLLNIIYEDDEMLIVNKPAGLVCHPTRQGPESSLIGRLRLYLGEGSHPQMVNRLDRETSGIIVVAKTDQCARSVRKIWERRRVLKEYLAIVHGFVEKNSDTINAALGKDVNSKVAVKDCVREDGAPATTYYRVLLRFEKDGNPYSLLKIIPKTGKKHQIRIHLSYIGHPVVSDKIYGGDETIYLNYYLKGSLTPEQQASLILPYQALHSSRVKFSLKARIYDFYAPPEKWFMEFIGVSTMDEIPGYVV
ncbi:MAG: RluA family pseudouridine synthase [Verrucomicrobiia bacterium]